jgi:glutamate racemase
VGILAEDGHGISVARALQRLLPREDLVLLCDDAYAPYARRRPAVVAARVASLLGDLRADGAKIIVVASPQAVLDAFAAQPAGPVALIGLEAPIPQAGAVCGGGPVAAVVLAGSVRPRTFGQALRRQRGASAIHLEEWPLDDAGAVAVRIPALIAAGVGALALTSPALSRLRPAIDRATAGELPVVEAGDVAAQRVQRNLRHAGLLARRRRPGRLIVISTNPSRAAGHLTA